MPDPGPTSERGEHPAGGSRQPAWHRRPAFAFRDMSLAGRLLVILMATSVGALVLAGIAITAREARSSRTATVHDLTSLGDVVATNCAAAMSLRDPDAARDVLASLAASRDIARSALALPDHSVFTSY